MRVTAAPPAPELGLTGQRFEARLGLYDFRTRFYDPAIGLFLQPDEVSPSPFDPQGLNRYAYVRGDPVRRVDPDGRTSFLAAIFGAAMGGAGMVLGGSAGRDLERLGGMLFEYGIGTSHFEFVLDAGGGSARVGISIEATLFRELQRRVDASHEVGVLRMLALADLKFGDVLVTSDGGLAWWIQWIPGTWGHGHAAFVLEAAEFYVKVASSDNVGLYDADNSDPRVGGRRWSVLRPGDNRLDEQTRGYVKGLQLAGKLYGGLEQYVDDQGGNVCSSFAAELYRVSGGKRLPIERYGHFVTPRDLALGLGPPIGLIDVPQATFWKRPD
jgi:RHS repeat-associated protein